jgi:ElaB/YqjD/DUF883 family membrane-anchored ribosome-binding protein
MVSSSSRTELYVRAELRDALAVGAALGFALGLMVGARLVRL